MVKERDSAVDPLKKSIQEGTQSVRLSAYAVGFGETSP